MMSGRTGRANRATSLACWLLLASACAAIVIALVARVLGPSDVWDQTQPKTVSYTTDMLVHGRWILPVERGEFPATKPPLYNWLAAPAVGAAGYASELAHKAPSMAALVMVWMATILLARWIDRPRNPTSQQDNKSTSQHGRHPEPSCLPWLAGLAIPTNYMLFKLGYLARPDMVLTLWLMLGWMAGTSAILAAEPRRFAQLAFWVCVGLAGLTKGPAALVLLVYGLIAGKALTGSWKSAARLGWLWGLPLAGAMVGAWLVAVWRVDPDHLYEELWYAEFAGRVTGTGPKGAENGGPWYFVTSLLHMPYYFLSRGAPWSVVAILAMVHLWRRNLDAIGHRTHISTGEASGHSATGELTHPPAASLGGRGISEAECAAGSQCDDVDGARDLRPTHPPAPSLEGRGSGLAWRNWRVITDGDGRWYQACAVLIVVTVVLFTFSTGKRADYVAVTVPPAAILAAYWLLRVRADVARWSPVLAPVGAGLTLAAMIVVEWLQPFAPSRGYGEEIRSFIEQAEAATQARPLSMAFYHAGPSHLQAFLGASEVDGRASLEAQLARGESFWLIAGPPTKGEAPAERVIAHDDAKWTLTSHVVSDPAVVGATWPGRMTLWLVEEEEKARGPDEGAE